MLVTFNTGRLYTRSGQIIVAEYDDGEIRFNDVSRMISGKFSSPNSWGDDQKLFIREVMHGYDKHQYKWCGNAPKYDPSATIIEMRI
jgi:hypothetical protein